MLREYNIRGHHLDVLYKFIYLGGCNTSLAVNALIFHYGNFTGSVVDKLSLISSDSKNLIKITDNLDDICNPGCPCPFRNENSCKRDGVVVSDEKAAKVDGQFIQVFNLKKGRVYTLKKLMKKIDKRIHQPNFSSA